MLKFKKGLKQLIANKQGSSLYLSIIVMTAILAIGLGVASLLLGQLQIARDLQRYVPAIYAADSGTERALYILRKDGTDPFGTCANVGDCEIQTVTMSNNATYTVLVVDPDVTTWCPTEAEKCMRSIGNVGDTNRAFEVIF